MRIPHIALALSAAFPLAACGSNEPAPEPTEAVDTRTPQQIYDASQTSAGISCNVNADVRAAMEAERTAADAYYDDKSRANWDAREAAKEVVAEARGACLETYFDELGVGDLYRAEHGAPQVPAAE